MKTRIKLQKLLLREVYCTSLNMCFEATKKFINISLIYLVCCQTWFYVLRKAICFPSLGKRQYHQYHLMDQFNGSLVSRMYFVSFSCVFWCLTLLHTVQNFLWKPTDSVIPKAKVLASPANWNELNRENIPFYRLVWMALISPAHSALHSGC